jgi:hypothetical protein
MGFQVDRATKIDFLVLVKGGRQKGSQVNPTVTPISSLAKGNRQIGFQVGQATNFNPCNPFLGRRTKKEKIYKYKD